MTGAQLTKLGEYYARAIHEHYGDDFDVLFGPAYKGIPLSVAAVMAYSRLYGKEIRYCSNRKEIKDHGDAGILLGSRVKDGDKVVIIEDVTTSGKSMEETAFQYKLAKFQYLAVHHKFNKFFLITFHVFCFSLLFIVSRKSMEETVPIIRAQADIEIKGLMVSLNRMERGKGEQSALEEIKELYGFDANAIVTMADVTEYLYNKPYKGNIYINDEMKAAIDRYYEAYGAK